MLSRAVLTLTAAAGVGLATLGWSHSSFRSPVDDEGAPTQPSFVERLVGEWRMEGRGRASPDAPWYKTSSTMSASLRLKDGAVVRSIDAPGIEMEALDIIWFHENTQKYTYIYLASNLPGPLVMTGASTDDDTIRVAHGDLKTQTVIQFIDDDEMVARDFRIAEDGTEWMSREVKHYREP